MVAGYAGGGDGAWGAAEVVFEDSELECTAEGVGGDGEEGVEAGEEWGFEGEGLGDEVGCRGDGGDGGERGSEGGGEEVVTGCDVEDGGGEEDGGRLGETDGGEGAEGIRGVYWDYGAILRM